MQQFPIVRRDNQAGSAMMLALAALVVTSMGLVWMVTSMQKNADARLGQHIALEMRFVQDIVERHIHLNEKEIRSALSNQIMPDGTFVDTVLDGQSGGDQRKKALHLSGGEIKAIAAKLQFDAVPDTIAQYSAKIFSSETTDPEDRRYRRLDSMLYIHHPDASIETHSASRVRRSVLHTLGPEGGITFSNEDGGQNAAAVRFRRAEFKDAMAPNPDPEGKSRLLVLRRGFPQEKKQHLSNTGGKMLGTISVEGGNAEALSVTFPKARLHDKGLHFDQTFNLSSSKVIFGASAAESTTRMSVLKDTFKNVDSIRANKLIVPNKLAFVDHPAHGANNRCQTFEANTIKAFGGELMECQNDRWTPLKGRDGAPGVPGKAGNPGLPGSNLTNPPPALNPGSKPLFVWSTPINFFYAIRPSRGGSVPQQINKDIPGDGLSFCYLRSLEGPLTDTLSRNDGTEPSTPVVLQVTKLGWRLDARRHHSESYKVYVRCHALTADWRGKRYYAPAPLYGMAYAPKLDPQCTRGLWDTISHTNARAYLGEAAYHQLPNACKNPSPRPSREVPGSRPAELLRSS